MPEPGVTPEAAAQAGKFKLIATIGAAAAALTLPFIGGWEGKRNDPYRDIVGVQTVCYGETRVDMRQYTDAECEAMLAEGIADFGETVLARNPGLKQRPYQLAAAVSLSYNIGPTNYGRSSVARHFAHGRWRQGCDAILLWNKAGGRVVKGLVRRREAERKVCLTDLPAGQ